jgi:type IV secretion system protein VirB9
MKRTRVFGLTAVLLLAGLMPALATTDGARIVQYSNEDIVPIHAKLKFSTLIVLPEDEEILDFTTGDKDFWIINGAHNLCYITSATYTRPRRASAAT